MFAPGLGKIFTQTGPGFLGQNCGKKLMGFFLSSLLTAKNNPLHNPGLWNNNLHRSGMHKCVIFIHINHKSGNCKCVTKTSKQTLCVQVILQYLFLFNFIILILTIYWLDRNSESNFNRRLATIRNWRTCHRNAT